MYILKNAEVYSPKSLGKTNLLVGGEQILAINEKGYTNLLGAETIDLSEKIVIPGGVDSHCHIIGGGGESGFSSRAPETQLSDYITAGITTTVGLLGTDGMTRSVENVVSKAKALKEEGITAYALSGYYGYPTLSVTDSIEKDIVYIEEIIGVKIAANDHRDSAITPEELIKLGTQARRAGMISGKSGHVTVHMGEGKFNFDQIKEALERSNIPITVFRPTHVNREKSLAMDAIEFAKKGGYIDITLDSSVAYEGTTNVDYILSIKEAGVDLSRVILSTDGFGSWSDYDDQGNLQRMGVIPIDTLLSTLKNLVEAGLPIEAAAALISTNTADAYKFNRKGHIEKGYDADLVILNEDLTLDGVMARGQWMMRDGELLKTGKFEK